MDSDTTYEGAGDAIERQRVLIVDDEPETRLVLGRVFSAQGYEVATARNGQEAIAQVQQQRPDLVLMDIRMPVLDGLSASKVIRSDSETKDIPIILITGNSNLRQQGVDAGVADATVSKPIDFSALLATVAECLRESDSAYS